MVCDLIDTNWWATGDGPAHEPFELTMSPAILTATNSLREFMYQNVYLGSAAKTEDHKVDLIIHLLYTHFMNHPERIPADIMANVKKRDEPLRQAVVDYVAGMTDRYATQIFQDIYIPRTWGG
jgi:dGTPase